MHKLLCPTLLALSLGCGADPVAGGGATAGEGEQASEAQGPRPRVAYVTNGVASFWVIAEAGARAAERDFDAHVEVRMPPTDDGAADQKRYLEELLAIGIDGIAISPVDPDGQLEDLNAAAARTNLITHDSDAPQSDRLAYVGMDNYVAGRMCGELVEEALPQGGDVMIFVGRLEQDNARLRRQGVIDELLDRTYDNTRFDPPGNVLRGEKYTVLDTRTDGFDFAKAKAQPEDAIAKHPELDCMVGLFAYNPPYILEALRGAGKLGVVKVVAFDEEGPTLEAIADGTCHGTVVQDPYEYGYRSVELLAALARDDRSLLPESGFVDIPARKITESNVAAFAARLKELTSGADDEGREGAPTDE